MDFNTIWSN